MGRVERLRVAVRGGVQGVGFRPFVYRLAQELDLKGWVNNSAQGVVIEVEGEHGWLEEFLLRLGAERPPRCFIQSLEATWLDAVGYASFEIRESETGGVKTALVLPDIATCPECLHEIFDPNNRRYFYPFTNCTNCGPRFSIIESLPYDRSNTSMKQFSMCTRCRAEYDDPRDRRFHAQPNACAACGPHLELWDREGRVCERGGLAGESVACSHERRYKIFSTAAEAIRDGKIVAVKGLGGFHLMVTAHDDRAVRRLRELKHREEKPLALMFPSFEAVKPLCEVSPFEERLLRAPEAPIVLLRRLDAARDTQTAAALSPSIAPGNPDLGVMLPYTPLHHLLLSLLGFPVVATSGNLSDEPICTDEQEARERLGGIADLFLVHNRPIVRHADDSIVRVMMERELVLRRARGYAPLPIQLRTPAESKSSVEIQHPASSIQPSVLGVGAHLKNTIALSVGPQVFISQHVGDLETDQAFETFRRIIKDFEKLYETRPVTIAADAHPDYLSTKFAHEYVQQQHSSGCSNQPPALNCHLLTVQHHIAHVLACMAENELVPPVLGVSWDGTGYGLDGTVWGGEFFLVTESSCERVGHFRPFRLPGGEAAVKEPRRTALGLLYELFGAAAFARADLAPLHAFSAAELPLLKTMLARNLNSPLTSSAGRLFDAVSSLVGLRQHVHFEGQAAMELEFALAGSKTNDTYPLTIANEPQTRTNHRPSTPVPPIQVDWASMIHAILADLGEGIPAAQISARFHNTMAEAIVSIAKRVGQERIVMSGGCFQNRYLTERAVRRLREEGFRPYWHQRVPPNDGGIALGQVVAAQRAGRLAHFGGES